MEVTEKKEIRKKENVDQRIKKTEDKEEKVGEK